MCLDSGALKFLRKFAPGDLLLAAFAISLLLPE